MSALRSFDDLGEEEFVAHARRRVCKRGFGRKRRTHLVNAFREDEVRPSLAAETALANAPARVGDEFLLPKIVEGAES